jgi:hypothetical protein
MSGTSSGKGTTANVVASSQPDVSILPSRGRHNCKVLRSAIITASGTLMVTGFQWIATHQIKLLQLCFALAASIAAARITYAQQKKQDEFRRAIDKLLNESSPARRCACNSDCIYSYSSAQTPDCIQHIQDHDPTVQHPNGQPTTARPLIRE